MIHFLRNSKGKNIISTEVYGMTQKDFDLTSFVYLNCYSETLLNISSLDKEGIKTLEFIRDMEYLQNLRGVYWEQLRYSGNVNTKKELSDFVKNKYKAFSEKYKLHYVND